MMAAKRAFHNQKTNFSICAAFLLPCVMYCFVPLLQHHQENVYHLCTLVLAPMCMVYPGWLLCFIVNCQMKAKLQSWTIFVKRKVKYACSIGYTTAFGMGVQIDYVDLVMHWCPCKSSLAYWQAIARCGRDARNIHAGLYFSPILWTN